MPNLSRREMLRASVVLVASTFAHQPLSVFGGPDTEAGAQLIPFLDQQPITKNPMLRWEQLKSWITPNSDVYQVQHYGVPSPADASEWKLDLSGLVKKPRTFTLDQIRALPKRTVTATLECSGNSSSDGFMGAIGNVRWTGTSVRSLLESCQPQRRGTEVVFFGLDTKVEKIRDKDYTVPFSRALSREEMSHDDILLCYEMNGESLAHAHGGPVRLVVPGWFGIAWVKWLNRIEVLDRRFMSKYMAREYVTLRGEEIDASQTLWRETSVGPMDVKSFTARAVRLRQGPVRFTGAAWTDGTPLERVEFRIDDGPWQPASLDTRQRSKYAWTFWRYDWANPTDGEHQVVSRAFDKEGRIQPSKDDPEIKLKRTYWEANQQWPRRIRIVTAA